MTNYQYFLYADYYGYFFVQIDRDLYDSDEDALTAADEVATEQADDPEFVGVYTEEQANEMGHDIV